MTVHPEYFQLASKQLLQGLLTAVSCRRYVAKVFSSESKHHSEIERAGHNAMVALFRGTPEESLNELRHRILLQKVTSAKSFVVPERLPTTESATRFHSYRSYYQIMVWKGLDQCMHATDWDGL